MNTDINIIFVQEDFNSNMASVSLNGECIMEGNFGDFYSGCHGIYDWGAFKNYNQLIKNIQSIILKQGKEVIIKRVEYEYE